MFRVKKLLYHSHNDKHTGDADVTTATLRAEQTRRRSKLNLYS